MFENSYRVFVPLGLLLPLCFSGCSDGRTAPAGNISAGNMASVDAAYALARQQPNLTSLVIARNGIIERQEYFNGGGAGVAQDVRSVTKSVVSLLVGIALERGYLHSLDQTLGELLGPLAPLDSTKGAITLRHLLTMTSGLGGNELADPALYNQWAAAPDQLTYVWNLPLVATPGAQFNYYSPNYYIISRILTRACGQGTSDFASGTLFAPLGIGSRSWETDDQGYFNGGAGLRLTPGDMVAIGNLVLASGRAGGTQVISSNWLQNSTTMKTQTNAMPGVSGYGYGWWVGQAAGSEYVMANGWGGQFIVVVPNKQLVVTAATNWQGVGNGTAGVQWQTIMDIVMQRIVPAY
jgi:CubicO group peptidase (beta-lactamase class C family)